MKKTMRSAMLSTIAMLVVAVLSLTGVTYAWFSMATTAEVSGMEMEIGTAGAGLQVSSDGASWGSKVEFTGKTSLQPVSTVDTTKFFTANVSVDDPTNIIAIAEDTAKANVWVETFHLRNTGTGELTVKLDAAVFADASEDTSYNAARIAIFKGDELVAIYGHHTATTYLAVAGTASAYPVAMGTAQDGVIASVSNKFTNDYTTIELQAPGYDDATNTQGSQEYTVMVWLEGQDPECGNEAALSKFTVALNFEVAE